MVTQLQLTCTCSLRDPQSRVVHQSSRPRCLILHTSSEGSVRDPLLSATVELGLTVLRLRRNTASLASCGWGFVAYRLTTGWISQLNNLAGVPWPSPCSRCRFIERRPDMTALGLPRSPDLVLIVLSFLHLCSNTNTLGSA